MQRDLITTLVLGGMLLRAGLWPHFIEPVQR